MPTLTLLVLIWVSTIGFNERTAEDGTQMTSLRRRATAFWLASAAVVMNINISNMPFFKLNKGISPY